MLSQFSQNFGVKLQTLGELKNVYGIRARTADSYGVVVVTDEDVRFMQIGAERDCWGIGEQLEPEVPESVEALKDLHNEIVDCLADSPPDYARQFLFAVGITAGLPLSPPEFGSSVYGEVPGMTTLEDYRRFMMGRIEQRADIRYWTHRELSYGVRLHKWICGYVQR